MSFYPIERLRNGNVDFLYSLSTYDTKSIINQIRMHPDRVNIINGFINILKDKYVYFCFKIIYDIQEFSDIAYKMLIDSWKINNLDLEMFNNILKNARYRDKLIREYFDELICLKDNFIISLCLYVIENRNNLNDILFKLSRCKNMHIRYLFMRQLLNYYPDLINIVYDDIFSYFIDYTYEENEQLTLLPEYMDIEEICDIAILFLKNSDFEMFNKIKEYILNNYKTNYLAYMLDRNEYYSYSKSKEEIEREEEFGKLKKQILLSDLDRLFITSSTYKIHLYQDYCDKLSKEILEDFEKRTRFFKSDVAKSSSNILKGASEEVVRSLFRNSRGFGYKLSNVYEHGLGDILESYVDKYLELSIRHDYEFVGEGSTCASYRIGDYVFKLIKMKWSYEDVICPNLYLILKNYEEIYVRDKDNIVVAGLEVQKYLTRSARDIDGYYFDLFKEELRNLGYVSKDLLINGPCGDNTMLLDSYKDADTNNPENLPDWFKECPLVLIDRDMIYKKDAKRIRQLPSF